MDQSILAANQRQIKSGSRFIYESLRTQCHFLAKCPKLIVTKLRKQWLGRNMHAAVELVVFWAFGFLTLCAAVALLNIFSNVIESDMELLSLGKEAVIAGIASLIEAAGVWLIVFFISATYRGVALRAMIIPLIIVALIYNLAHLESWSVFETGLLLAFQIAIGCLIASLISRHFLAAVMVVVVFGIILAVIAVIAKSLWG
jgi:hypothetical protein